MLNQVASERYQCPGEFPIKQLAVGIKCFISGRYRYLPGRYLAAEVGEVGADGGASVTIKIEKLKVQFFDDNEQNENTVDISWSSGDDNWNTRPGMMEDARWPKLAGSSLTINVSPDGKINSAKGMEDDEVQKLLKTLRVIPFLFRL